MAGKPGNGDTSGRSRHSGRPDTQGKAGGSGEATAGAADPVGAGHKPPGMRVLAQYLKSLSFENPKAPQSLRSGQNPPKVDIAVNVNARTMSAADYEVELHLEAKALDTDRVTFAVGLLYAGIFRIENVPQHAVHPIIFVECPRMLFPFARKILADATQQGGFPPLLIGPIDFAAMYRQQQAQERTTRA